MQTFRMVVWGILPAVFLVSCVVQGDSFSAQSPSNSSDIILTAEAAMAATSEALAATATADSADFAATLAAIAATSAASTATLAAIPATPAPSATP